MAVKCKNCKNYISEEEKTYCEEDIWDRTDPEQEWLHDDDEFDEYINQERFCSEYVENKKR